MATHAAEARELLEGLKPITGDPGGTAEVRATAALTHAVLALTEQLSGTAPIDRTKG